MMEKVMTSVGMNKVKGRVGGMDGSNGGDEGTEMRKEKWR